MIHIENMTKNQKNDKTNEADEMDISVRPLTDDDVLLEMSQINKVDKTIISDIFNSYYQEIQSILTAASRLTQEEIEIVELERLRRLIRLLPIEELFIRSKDKIWAVRNHILNKNADYFLNKDYSKIIKKDKKQGFIESIISIIKDRYTEMDDANKEFYWQRAIKLLHCVARLKKELSKLNE